MARDITAFRGLSGEIVTGFVRPGTFFTCFPVFFYWLFIGIGIAFMGDKIPPPLLMLFLVLASSYLVGRFAIQAQRGDLHCGFFSTVPLREEYRAYALRYLVLTLSWAIPVAIIGWFLVKTGQLSMFDLMSGPSLVGAGFTGIVVTGLLVVCILAPTICFLLAACTETVSEALGLQVWITLFVYRREDLVAFYAALVGGMFVFIAIYLIPYAVITAIGFSMDPAIGMFLGGMGYLVPSAASPVLIGRLAGAFAQDPEYLDGLGGAAEQQDLKNAFYSDPAMATASAQMMMHSDGVGASSGLNSVVGSGVQEAVSAAPQPLVTVDVKQVVAEIKSISAEGIDTEISDAKVAVDANPRDLKSLVRLVYLHLKKKEVAVAKTFATKAIELALNNKAGETASLVFRSFKKERFSISLSGQGYRQLHAVLLEEEQFGDAAWCLMTAAKVEPGDLQTTQKLLVQIADAASNAGKAAEALALYTTFLKKYPDSTFSDYVRQAAENQRRHV